MGYHVRFIVCKWFPAYFFQRDATWQDQALRRYSEMVGHCSSVVRLHDFQSQGCECESPKLTTDFTMTRISVVV